MIRGVIFDLDGTLVDSRLDFDAMRRDMELPAGQPILEAIAQLDAERARRCWAILDRHEFEGARLATLMPGARELIDQLAALGLHTAIFTRNSRAAALATLGRLGLAIETVFAREDAPAKPDPLGIHLICERWGCQPAAVLAVGDYKYDLEAARSAGAPSVLYTAGRDVSQLSYARLADHVVESLADIADLIERGSPARG